MKRTYAHICNRYSSGACQNHRCEYAQLKAQRIGCGTKLCDDMIPFGADQKKEMAENNGSIRMHLQLVQFAK